MKNSNLLLLIFILAFIFSCDSDNDTTPEIGYKLVKIETYRMPNDELKETTIFEYNEDGFVSKTERTHYNSGLNTTNYIYTNGKITTIEYVYSNASENHTYTGDLITSSIYNNIVSQHKNHSYFYNANSQVIKNVSSNDDSISELVATYTYDSNSNMLSEDYTTHSYYSTYDTKKNPFRLVFPEALLKIKFIGQNNVLTNDYGNVNTYEYNDNDYPSRLNNYYIGEFSAYILFTYEEI